MQMQSRIKDFNIADEMFVSGREEENSKRENKRYGGN